ncbi:MAG: hypothetical protein KF824_11150 [Fimbriimonadaceae bacterium]|nr:MAG: hypothetical protein KF824_11150 [Fimbriimonadaceae bacterium]
MKQKKKRISPWLIGCGGLGIVIAGLITWAVLQVADYPLVAPRINKTVEEYKATGLPWVASEVIPAVPDAENAAIEIKEALAMTKGESFASRDKKIIDAWKARNKATVAAELKKIEPALAKAIIASKKTKINFDRDWNKGPDVLFPEFAEIKGIAKTLTRRAVIKAESGDLTGAIVDLTAVNRLSKLISNEPTLIAMLVGIACNAICMDGVIRVAQIRSDSNSLAKLANAVSGFNDEFDFGNAMRGEAYMGITLIRNLKPSDIKKLSNVTAGDESEIEYKRTDGIPNGMMMQAYFVRHLEAHLFIHEQLKKYPDDPIMAAVEIDNYTVSMTEGVPKLSQILNAILMPVFVQASHAVVKVKTNKQMVLAMLKSLEFRNSKKRFPKSLDEIGVNYVDQISGEKITSLNSGGVYRIYSLGPNAVDDKGLRDNDTGQDDYSIQFPPKPW